MKHAQAVTQVMCPALVSNMWGKSFVLIALAYRTKASFLPHISYNYLWRLEHI